MAKNKKRNRSRKQQPSPPVAQVSRRWAEAVKLSEEGNALKAIQELEEVLRLAPRLPGAHYDLALVHDRMGRFAQAMANYERELELNPTHADAHHNLACIHASQGNFDRARELFQKALALNPAHPHARQNLERMEHDRKLRQASAIAETQAEPRLSVCMIVKNEEYYLRGCLEGVRGLADEIIIVDTGSTDSTVETARSFGAKVYFWEWRDDFAAARNESLKYATGDWVLILDADERLDEANCRKIRELMRHPRYQAYFVELRSPEGGAGRGITLSHLYARLFRNGLGAHFEGAIHEQIFPSLYRRGIEVGYSDVSIFHLGYAKDAVSLRRKGERNLALLEKQVKDYPDACFVRFNLGKNYMMMERHDEALQELRKALSLPSAGPHLKANAHESIASILFNAKNDLDGCIEECHKALSYDDTLVTPRLLLGNAYFRKGQYEAAAAEFERSLEESARRDTPAMRIDHAVEPSLLHASRGVCLLRAGRHQEAAICFRRALDLGTDDGETWHNLGLAAQALGRHLEAAGAYRRAADLLPSLERKGRALVNLGVVYLQQGDEAEAERAFLQARDTYPALSEARVNLALLWAKQGKGDLAKKELFLSLLTDKGGDSAVLKLLERLCQETSDWKALAEVYRRQLEQGESPGLIWHRLGQLHRNLGNTAHAQSCFEMAISFAPDFAQAWHDLGLCHAQRQNFEQARACLSHALKLAPDSADIPNDLGVVALALKDRDEAGRYFAQALEKSPGHPQALRNLQGLLTLDEKSEPVPARD